MKQLQQFSLNLLTIYAFVARADKCGEDWLKKVADHKFAARQHIQSAWNFDWDDNVVTMPTTIIAFRKGSGEKAEIATAPFAEIRHTLGKSGDYADYELRFDPEKGSFWRFRDPPNGTNYFLEDLKSAYEKKGKWMAPSFLAFASALNYPETARRTTLITARGHSREKIMEGLRYLQAKKCFKHLPPAENIYAVAGTENPSLAKVEVMKKILKDLNEEAFHPEAPLAWDQDGKTKKKLHLWGFSDDDYGNYSKAIEYLSQEAKNYPNVKITIFYTGFYHPGVQPKAEIITLAGQVRAPLKGESTTLSK